MRPPRVYLAGPEVFLPDAHEAGEALKAVAAQYGLEGVFPLDGEVEVFPTEESARLIFKADLDLLDSCDAVLAHMVPFRGPSMDVGTAFEMGYAYAQRKPIVGYSASLDHYWDKVWESEHAGPSKEADRHGQIVEHFGLMDNLMVTCSPLAIVTTAAEAARLLAAHLAAQRRAPSQ